MNARILLMLLTALPAMANACGHERWAIKTGTDHDASEINLSDVVPAEVENLTHLSAPSHLPLHHRIKPIELSVYYVKATLLEYKREKDGDYYLVLKGRHGQTMIAEIPSPDCVGSNSPLKAGIKKARREFNARYKVTRSFGHVHTPVTVTGVGFFDFDHGQTGAAPNAIELHPVLDIQFGS